MHGYVVSRPVVLRSGAQVKHIGASEDLDTVDASTIQISASIESKLVREQLMRQFPRLPVDTLVRFLPHHRLAMWEHFPMLLGRRTNDAACEGSILTDQLLALKAQHPQRRHFHLLINNGFGMNLGDTMIGLTAFRAVWALLKASLPEVSVDVLLGWEPWRGVPALLQQEEGIQELLYQGPTLESLAHYQGLIDFGGLIKLARYGTMAPVDWYLWRMGLDPAEVRDSDKRNRITLNLSDKAAVSARLQPAVGRKVLLNPMASEPLRRMPVAALRALATAALESDPALHVVFDQPVAFEHPRAIHLPDVINSPQRLAALVAQVQGIITPDTFVQHVADATGTPTCTLSASVPAAFFRYYPTVQTRVLPNAESLGGWGKTKVSQEQWEELAPSYAEAWSRLEPAAVLAALNQAEIARQQMPPADVARIDSPRQAFKQALVIPRAVSASSLAPSGQLADATSEALERQLLRLGGQILLPGDTVALLGAGAGEMACSLGARIAPCGRLVVFEPRRMIHQLVCANVLLAGHAHVETHSVMPTGSDFSIASIPRLVLQDDHVALARSNQLVREPVIHWPLDRLELPHCRLIVLQSPIPLLEALQGAANTVARHRPFVVAGLVRPEELTGWQQVLRDEDYIVRSFRLKDLDVEFARDPAGSDDRSLVIVAEPRKTAVSKGRT